jgi:DNA-binding beta-propeller fold protein YncE
MKKLLSILTLSSAMASAATVFLGAYPDSLLVFDESKGQVVDHIKLTTGLPTAIRLSMDGKKIYVTTNDHTGIEVVDFSPIGPAPAGMAGLQLTPDKKTAYTVITTGALGNKRCEFWTFDLASNRMTQNAPVPCRSRFSFGISGDGKKLYLYGAGFEIEVHDAVTLKYERTGDLQNDVTMAGMITLQ